MPNVIHQKEILAIVFQLSCSFVKACMSFIEYSLKRIHYNQFIDL